MRRVVYRLFGVQNALAAGIGLGSAIGRLHLDLIYDIVGFLSKVVRSYENLCS